MNPGVHSHALLIRRNVGQLTNLRQVLFVVWAGMAENPELQCTRMKLLTQPAALETKKHKFSFIKGLSVYEKYRFLNQKASSA